jgi:RNA polymerase sigma factor (sigma-70 family)
MKLYYLLIKAQEGDKDALLNILIKFNPIIKSYSRKLNYAEAETDLIIVLLETIISINLNNFEPENEGALVNYIHKVMKNKSVNLFKKNILRTVKPVEFDVTTIPDSCNFDSQIFISRLLDSLPILQKEIIEKKFIYEYSDKEIAQLHGVSRQAVNRTKNRALNNLRNYLLNEGGQNID